MEEIKIPSAKEMRNWTKESEVAYSKIVNHIVRGIKREVAECCYQYRKQHVDACYIPRISSLFLENGYEVTVSANRVGDDYSVTIEWYRDETDSKD